MARYPITAGQFQVFVDDENGANNPAWWQGLALLKPQSLIAQTFRFSNHPRDSVSWYQAVAFCRWLSAQGGYQVRLPTEQEWEKAARGPDGRVYAWGNDYFSGYANLDETIANMSHPEGVGPYHLSGTSTVGIYPQGASPYGLLDMCGNVWEWCLNTDRVPEAIRPDGEYRRVLRGGAWHFRLDYAQTTTRYLRGPLLRSYDIGFRVVCDSPQ
jgi:formylglycine-generating enzyme required for sulfatase activity